MTSEERKKYWASEIVFDCPHFACKPEFLRHSVEWCFNNCEFSGRTYHDGAAWIVCLVDPYGEREVHNGKPTRFN